MKTEYSFADGKRGAVVKLPRGWTCITIPIDNDVLQWFRQRAHTVGGGNYLRTINAALREYVREHRRSVDHCGSAVAGIPSSPTVRPNVW